MKAITIHQPWASLIALGYKQFETRSWSPAYRGPILIHAGKSELYIKDMNGLFDDDAWQIVASRLLHRHCWSMWDLPRGAIVGVANLVSVHRAEDMENAFGHELWNPQERALGAYGRGRYALRMAGAFPLQPVACKGAQSIWNYTGVLPDKAKPVPSVGTVHYTLEKLVRLANENLAVTGSLTAQAMADIVRSVRIGKQ